MQFRKDGRYTLPTLSEMNLSERAKIIPIVEPPLPPPPASPPPPPGPGSDTPWPALTQRDITATFKVIGDLSEGTKVKIVDDRCLAVDDSYMPSFYRSYHGQNRERMKSFLRSSQPQVGA